MKIKKEEPKVEIETEKVTHQDTTRQIEEENIKSEEIEYDSYNEENEFEKSQDEMDTLFVEE